MQKNLFSVLFATRPTEARAGAPVAKSAPIQLPLAELDQIAGGLAPNSTWGPAAVTTQAPNSTW